MCRNKDDAVVHASESLLRIDLPPSITAAWRLQLAEPHRHYHTHDHVEHMLHHLPAAEASKEMIAAIWLHDIVYDPHASDNEEKSAIQAMHDLNDTNIDVERVADLIRGTKHHQHGSDMQNMLNDLDLGIFGAPHDAYERYARQIRAEYAFVPEHAYTAGRIAILARYNAMQLFKTKQFADREGRAHANLQWEIEKLRTTGAAADPA